MNLLRSNADHHLGQSFSAAAAAFPERPAVTAGDESLTYRQLELLADMVAGRLRACGAGPGVVIGLYTTRSTRMVGGMVGIVQSGAAYLPIDPTTPVERVRWLLADSHAGIVVTEAALLPNLSGYDGPIEVLDGPEVESPVDRSVTSGVNQSDLAYVIYTSGSTGIPKGVLVEHRSVTRLFESTQDVFGFDENDTWAMFHSVAFDFSVWEMWGALIYGGHLIVVPHDTARSPRDVLGLVRDSAVTVLNQTPSAFRQLMAADPGPPAQALPALRLVILGGERLDIGMLRPWIERRGHDRPQLVNMYGITEATVHASYRRIRTDDLSRPEVSPIGSPLPDLRFLVLDPTGRPVADGQAGELSIAGPGVARGYLGRDDLTAQRFSVLADGSRVFRTGDRVSGCDGDGDGYIYLGRADDQIKVRGYRIEPREIEVVLERHPEVSTCVVTARDYGDGDVRLVAYLVPRDDVDAGERWCRATQPEFDALVASALPVFMKPSAYLAVPEPPMTTNGKIDKAALPRMPAPAGPPPAGSLSSTEHAVAALWREVVGIEVTSRDDDFFDLGGTSLALIRMFDHVNTMFGTDLAVTVLLDGATVALLATSIDTALSRPTCTPAEEASRP